MRPFYSLLIFFFCTSLPLLSGPEKASSPAAQSQCSSSRGTCSGGKNHISSVLEHLKQTRPEEYQRLQQLRLTNRQEFFRQMRAMMPMEARHQFYAKFRKMENEQKNLAKKYQQTADPQEKEQILLLLKKNIAENHELFLQDLKKRIQKMQKRIAQMEENSEKIKEQKLQRLLRNAEGQPRLP